MHRTVITLIVVLLVSIGLSATAQSIPYRTPTSDADARYWLANMIWHHNFIDSEVVEATGYSLKQVVEARQKFNIHPNNKPADETDGIKVLPYPGGRHPRIGFLEGAVWPQRETKVSVFTPWDDESYIVVDVPEAIWSNHGLTYLAHTHVPTIWDQQDVELEKLEWNRNADGTLDITRKLPNNITYSSKVIPDSDQVRFEMTLHNGTDATLSDLRVQMCAMLKNAEGFNEQTNDNKIFKAPYTAVHNEAGDKWIVYAWQPCHRPWGNTACPCLHSDPKFPDLKPGETGKLVGFMGFYEGTDIEGEFERIAATGWDKD